MMKLACKDLSPQTVCTFEVSADSEMGAAEMMLAHARTDHAADIAGMSDEEVLKAFTSKVHA
jgi:predicted small metal-binding protein